MGIAEGKDQRYLVGPFLLQLQLHEGHQTDRWTDATIAITMLSRANMR